MDNWRQIFTLEISLLLIFIVTPIFAQDECDKTKCPGPLRFYEEIKCKPIYKNPGDCCAMKYDCSHMEERFKSKKCYVHDNVYEIREKLKEEDSLPCNRECICMEHFSDSAEFTCAVEDCFAPPPKKGCYREHLPEDCCPGREICPSNPATCVVDGKTLTEGDYFKPKDKPNVSCYCKPGYTGENIEPFCHEPNKKSCGLELRSSFELKNKCAPIYHESPPQTSCNHFFRCPDENDKRIPSATKTENTSTDESDTCKFGKIVMHIGDEINPKTDDMYKCVKCKCEVPPTPTCQQISDKECDKL
ncbi:uncharacterized protein LOC122505554 [Leptopilina heterotoma]|uniref:uncharacterized protein LOC122505554 n=1 Tax=Leptopilina heterotoma TaxID=63436 RepID=UPI001CA7C654|nr:uncharacterized protein LOC122505554 [Leptopilina heterotoma]